MDKIVLRQELKTKRSRLSVSQLSSLSRKITSNCLAVVDWPAIKSIHSYLPIAENNEIDPLPLIKYARRQNPDIKIASWSSKSLDAKAIWLDSKLRPLKEVPQNFQYGLIIVPLLGFDTQGHRLGYGGGFYDEFLAGQEHALTIGLCYEFGHFDNLPAEEHDVPLNLVITEEKIYKT